MIYFTSDIHFGHSLVIAVDGRPYETREEMDEAIIETWNARVTDEDTVYILGDFMMAKNAKRYLPRLNGKLILIEGNHDTILVSEKKNRERFEEIKYMEILQMEGHPHTLCHYPMIEWKGSRRAPEDRGYGYLLHGHSHNLVAEKYRRVFEMPNAINVSMDVNGCRPVTLEEAKENNRVFHKRALEILPTFAEREVRPLIIRELTLDDKRFEQVLSGEKTTEMRLFDEKRKVLRTGDIVRFRKKSDPNVCLHTQITGLETYPTFAEAFVSEEILRTSCVGATAEESASVMRTYYDEERERACGVLCIRMEKY